MGSDVITLLLFLVSGVSVMKGQEEVHIHAPMIISNAGIFNTYQKLLPKELQAMPGQWPTSLTNQDLQTDFKNKSKKILPVHLQSDL